MVTVGKFCFHFRGVHDSVVDCVNREFKQITTVCATTAALTEKVWGEYVSVVCQILSLASKAKYKDEDTSAKEFKIFFI